MLVESVLSFVSQILILNKYYKEEYYLYIFEEKCKIFQVGKHNESRNKAAEEIVIDSKEEAFDVVRPYLGDYRWP